MRDSEKLETVRKLFRFLDEFAEEAKEFSAVLGQFPPDAPPENAKFTASHGKFYAHPAPLVAALGFKALGVLDVIQRVAESDNPNRALLDWASTYEPDAKPEELPPYWFPAIVATGFSLYSVFVFHHTIYELLQKAAQGDDEKLFQAVRIDATVLEVGTVGSRIAWATLSDDRSFFDRLAKAITKTKPSLPKPHLDSTRFLFSVLDEAAILHKMTVAEITALATDELGLLSPEGDPHSAVRDQWRKRRKARGGQN